MAFRIATAGALLTVLFSTAAPAVGEEKAGVVEQPVGESAAIAGDHALLADYFRAMAVAARSRTRLYETMARESHPTERRAQLEARHYERLAEQYGAMAEEYDALATLHDEEAREAP